MENTPARILIVDDEPSITEFVSYAMQKEGYQTEIASDGEEALRKIEQQHFDLFILDIMLPGIFAVAFAQKCLLLFSSFRHATPSSTKLLALSWAQTTIWQSLLVLESFLHAPELYFGEAKVMRWSLEMKFLQEV